MAIALVLLLLGCTSDPALGTWEGEENSSDVITLNEVDGTREIVLVGTLTDGRPYVASIEWSVEWVALGNNAYDLELDCVTASASAPGATPLSGCAQLADFYDVASFNFDMECDLDTVRDQLECRIGSAGTPFVYDRKL